MKQKIVFVTGASSGFGLEIIKLLAKKHSVYAGVRNIETSTKVDGVTYLKCDVTSEIECISAIKTIQESEGELHFLINNAGCALGGFFEDISDDQFRKQMDVNFFGVLAVTRAALPVMRQTNGNKKIIMMSSIAGLTGTPSVGAYNASKWALEGFSESLLFEVNPFDIDVVLIEPGTFKTDIFTRNLTLGTTMENPTSPYFNFSKTIKDLFDKRIGAVTGDPKDVATLVSKIIQTKRPKFRYLIGRDAIIRFYIRKWIPFSWYARLIRKIVKM